MGIWLGPITSSGLTEDDFSFNGNYIFTVDPNDKRKWELFLESGNAESLVFTKTPGLVDMFIVAGGQSGKQGDSGSAGPYYEVTGGQGGYGGECKTVSSVRLFSGTNYSVTIGASNQNTSFIGGGLSYTAVSGEGSSGGVGGYSYDGESGDATNGTDGVYAFNENSSTIITQKYAGHKFGAGGGGSGTLLGYDQYYNSKGGLGGESNGPAGDRGAGARAIVPGNNDDVGQNGINGYENHGQGGGGTAPYALQNGRDVYPGVGSGGSGIIIIRPAA